MKITSWVSGLAAVVILGVTVAQAQVVVDVQSLRGFNAIDADADMPNPKRWRNESMPIARDYVTQPPLIPHSIDGYQVNLKFNKCMTCHSWANYRTSGATKIPQTHFEDREHHVLANVSGTRYFCTQCHVSQRDANPLVKNTFKPVEALQ